MALRGELEGDVYSWGEVEYGCGYAATGCQDEPKRIAALSEFKVDVIKCGRIHSYCRTQCGKHFLFGYNSDRECITMGAGQHTVWKPHRIDSIEKVDAAGSIVGGVSRLLVHHCCV